jgi:hypothetical protein
MNWKKFRLWAAVLSVLALLSYYPPSLRAAAASAATAATEEAEDTVPGAAREVPDDTMNDVFARFGVKAPEGTKPLPPKGTEGAKETAKGKSEEELAAEAEATAKEEGRRKKEETTTTGTAEELRTAATEAEAALAADPESAELKAAAEEARTAATAASAKADEAEGVVTLELSAEQESYLKQEVEARTSELSIKLAAAETKVAELETQVQTLGVKRLPIPAGIHPLFLTDEANDFAKRTQELTEFKAWALENWDGFEAPEGSKEKSFTKEEVRRSYASVENELTTILPAAQQRLQLRQAWTPVVQKTYPELLDARHPHSKVVAGILQACPNLRLIPNYMILIGDSLAGEKLRMDKAKAVKAGAGAKATVSSNGKTIIRVAKKPAPSVPVGARPGRTGPSDRTPAKLAKGAADVAGFVKGGGTRDALLKTVAQFWP